jgi:hypothetical protein
MEQGDGGQGGSHERVFAPASIGAPRLVVGHSGAERGNTARSDRAQTGTPIGVRQAAEPRELDLRATVQQSILRTGHVAIAREDLHERVRAPRRTFCVRRRLERIARRSRSPFVNGAGGALIEGGWTAR